MNESEKNIETCLPESVLAEVASVPTDPQFVSLVEESFDPLKQQAFQQAGSDAYNEVVKSHQPYTFTSSVRQMKSNLILLLRRFWRFPFGTGTLRSLSDMWAHYITRLQGSETYGIPSRLDQLTDLPSAPLLVADRKISGVPEAEDGMSMARILCDSAVAATITEIVDDNTGWTMTKVLSGFPNVGRIVMGCRRCIVSLNSPNYVFPVLEEIDLDNATAGGGTYPVFYSGSGDLVLPKVKSFYSANGGMLVTQQGGVKSIYAPDMETYHGAWIALLDGCLDCHSFIAPKLRSLTGAGWNDGRHLGNYSGYLGDHDYLTKVIVGYGSAFSTNNCMCNRYNLIHVEIRIIADTNVNMRAWSPTNALDATGTDLVEDPTAHPTWNNLQQFLQNFRSFIVLRLANRKSTTALTLTLSAAVYNAVTGANSGWASQHTLAELGITTADLTDLETELGITSATIYATWLDTYTGANGIHWNVNKAN